MEIVLKGVLGALVAILLHFAANSKHHYLSGLIPLFPTFALFAHSMFASSGRTADMQMSAQFGMLSLVPYAIYLMLTWWLAVRLNVWSTLLVAITGWAAVALAIVILWNKGHEFVVAVFTSPLCIALAAATSVSVWFAVRLQTHKQITKTRAARPIACVRSSRGLSAVLASTISIALVAGSVYHYRSQSTRNDVRSNTVTNTAVATCRVNLPCRTDTPEQLNPALIHDPCDAASQEVLQRMFSCYVTFAKNAESAGNHQLASLYLSRARNILFGHPVHVGYAVIDTTH